MAEQVVYLNGRFVALSEATVPVLDRGFIFGDGIYDVIPVYQRNMFRAEHHLARLTRSLSAVGIQSGYTTDQWLSIIRRLIQEYDADDQMVYVQVTRGVAKRAHAFPLDVAPTVFIMAMPLPVPSQSMREHGVACVTQEDKRWLHCNIKSISLLGNVLAAQYAAENGVLETIQFRDGFLTEASSSNVWVAKDGKLIGPLKNNLVLEGVRYGLFEQLCADHDIRFETRNITRDEVFAADEVLLSSAAKEVLPVTMIDDKPVGGGKPGPMYAKLYGMYQQAKDRQCGLRSKVPTSRPADAAGPRLGPTEPTLNQRTVAVIHTSPATVELFARLLAEQLPEARIVNMLDDSVLPQLRDNGGDIGAIAPRWSQYARIARDNGACVILNACSSIGELCEPVEHELGIPVIRVDSAMAEKAVGFGHVVAVAATLPSTLRPTCELLAATAQARGRHVEVRALLVEGAYAALMAGNREEHDDLIAAALIRAAGSADAVVLAQASMARVLPRLTPEQQAKCLVSPALAVDSVVRAIRAA